MRPWFPKSPAHEPGNCQILSARILPKSVDEKLRTLSPQAFHQRGSLSGAIRKTKRTGETFGRRLRQRRLSEIHGRARLASGRRRNFQVLLAHYRFSSLPAGIPEHTCCPADL